ncbi:MAG: xanthine dehydrogenase family protein subunit M [Desulfobacteraceae bacterium]|nr:MAG: xanthine dehydrogenase family protein subunit M [Desulfobacteraceae bacterium]
MLLNLPEFSFLSCDTIRDACLALSTHEGEAQVLAGGTDLLVKMKHRKTVPRNLINIKRIPNLDYIHYDESYGLRIGALATVESLTRSSVVMRKFPVLGEAASVLGTPHVRALATLGGNLCNASPAAECGPALLTMGAKVKIAGPEGERVLSLESFFTGPGKTVLRTDEILTEIQIPNLPPHTGGLHLKHALRRVDIAVAGVSILMTVDGRQCQNVRIALSAVGPTPFRAKKAEAVLKGKILHSEKEDLISKAAKIAAQESTPIDDMRGKADYRRHLVEVMVIDGVCRLITEMISQTACSQREIRLD